MIYATPRQRRFFERKGVHSPPTQDAASRLRRYITKGNGVGGDTEEERIATVRWYEEQYVSKNVFFLDGKARNRLGTVSYLWARSEGEVGFDEGKDGEVHPFSCVVLDHVQNTFTVPAACLRLAEERRASSE